MLDPTQMRNQTRARLPRLGFAVPPAHLPILFEPTEGYSLRPIEEIISRTAVLNVAIAVSFGMPRDQAQRWIADNDLSHALSPLETDAIAGRDEINSDEIQIQVESMWAFVWILGLGDELSPSALCPDDLVRRVPDLRTGESLSEWRRRSAPVLRSPDAVMSELDLHYCMTWGLADANLNARPAPGRIDQYAIWQRRRALEFAIAERSWTHEDWGYLDLST